MIQATVNCDTIGKWKRPQARDTEPQRRFPLTAAP
jgi:hypothetical protein